MNNYLLSIIIPVYNVEKYLRECIESILFPYNDNVELILVDDGSTDESPLICDEYSNNSHVIVAHIKNHGPSYARNKGIALSHGKYVGFVDSDDFISKGSIQSILDYIEEDGTSDICFLNANKVFPNGKILRLEVPFDTTYVNDKPVQEVVDYLTGRDKYPGSACTKIYKRDFLVKNDIKFPCNGLLCEDLVFVMEVFYLATKFHSINVDYYNYRQSISGSRTNSSSCRTIDGCMYFIESSIRLLLTGQKPNEKKSRDLMGFVAYEFCQIIWLYAGLNKNEKVMYLDKINDNAWVLQYGKSKQTKVIYHLHRIFGTGVTGRIIKIVKKYL